MKSNLIAVILTFIAAAFSIAQENNNNWGKLSYLIGDWKGEGSGKPGEGGGYFTFKLDLDGKILIRNSHSEYPAAQDKPLIVHNDLLIVYLNYSGNPDKAIYFDNEGHIINYSITFSPGGDIVFTSENSPNIPVFRLTYSKIENNLLNVKFEISQDGVNYVTYVEGKSRRQ